MTSARPSATLYREGAELDELLAELDEQHPGQVRVVDVTYGREGGVLGFFAKRRVGVRYALDADGVVADTVDELDVPDGFDDAPRARHAADPLDELLTAADAAEAEAMVTHGVAPDPADSAPDGQPNVEFARLLLDLALTKAQQRRAAEEAARAAFIEPGTRVLPAVETVTEPRREPVMAPIDLAPPAPPVASPVLAAAAPAAPVAPPAPVAPVAPAAIGRPAMPAAREVWTAPPPPVRRAAPVATPRQSSVASVPQPRGVEIAELLRSVRTRPVGAHRATPDDGTRTEFTLRRQLAELGVPVSWIPDGVADAYWAIERLCTRVPAAPALDIAPGAVIVVAGPGEAALSVAHELCERNRINPAALVSAGCTATELPARRDVTQRWQARKLADDTRAVGREPVLVAVDTEAGSAWAAGIIAELAPDVLWTVVDATRKPADLRRVLAGLGRPSDALAVVNATRTASPASVWELDAPVAMIDGRPATRGMWASLLIDGLAALEC